MKNSKYNLTYEQVSFFPKDNNIVHKKNKIKINRNIDKDLNNYINSIIETKIRNYIKNSKEINKKELLHNTEKILNKYKMLKDTSSSEEILHIGIILKEYLRKSKINDKTKRQQCLVQKRKNKLLKELYMSDEYVNQQQFMDNNYYDNVQFYRDKTYLLQDLSILFF